jgi:hypothetical protein
VAGCFAGLCRVSRPAHCKGGRGRREQTMGQGGGEGEEIEHVSIFPFIILFSFSQV